MLSFFIQAFVCFNIINLHYQRFDGPYGFDDIFGPYCYTTPLIEMENITQTSTEKFEEEKTIDVMCKDGNISSFSFRALILVKGGPEYYTHVGLQINTTASGFPSHIIFPYIGKSGSKNQYHYIPEFNVCGGSVLDLMMELSIVNPRYVSIIENKYLY